MRRERLRDYGILLAVGAVLTLPNLGATSLWDVDEGVNAEAAREMRDNDTWVIPTFNYQLRAAKPVMLYWLQRASYTVLGVNEWSARLPSVLAAWLAVLLTYELARRMFDRGTGLLAGVALASAFEVCLLARAATPDAALLLFTVLTYYLFWTRHEAGSRKWWRPTAAACGLAVLTKGPVGVALPGLVIVLYFAWNRELRRLLDHKLLIGAVVFLLVAGPWYAFVTADTRGEYARVFFGRENFGRFSTPMEGHSGPIWYHVAVLFALFAPWSVFLGAAVWYGAKTAGHGFRAAARYRLVAWRNSLRCFSLSRVLGSLSGGCRRQPIRRLRAAFTDISARFSAWRANRFLPSAAREPRPERFLICWFAAYLVFFSAAATKLPNYMLPVYPALAILTARFLTRWRRGELAVPNWVMSVSVAGLVLTALAVGGGLLVVGGVVSVLPPGARVFPGLGGWAILGAIPLAAAGVMARAARANDRSRFVRAMAAGAVALTALAAAFPPLAVDHQKAPRELVRASGIADPEREVRLAHCDWFQPSVVFYARREVVEMNSAEFAAAFLAVPTPAYLFIPAPTWEQFVEPKVPVPTRIAARHHDFLRNCEILVVTNDVTATTGR